MNKTLFDSIVPHTDDGVLLLSRDGVVLSANAACSRLLGMTSDMLLGQSYSWLFFHETENQLLSQIINDGLKKEISYQLKELVYKSPQNTEHRLLISTLALPAQDDNTETPSLLVFLKGKPGETWHLTSSAQAATGRPEEVQRLSAQITALQEQNRILAAKRTRKDLFSALLAGLILFVLLTIIFSSRNGIRIFPKTTDVRSVSLAKRPVAARLDTLPRLVRVSGVLEPYYKVTLTAQTSGPIVKKNFTQGDFVEKGHILYQLDTKELAKSVRTARVAYIELLENYNSLKDWQSSLEVMQAKRTLELAKIAENSEKKKLEETKKLFEKGIIPRVEYDQATTTYKKTGYDYENAKQQLETTLEKGNPERIEVLKLKLFNAKEELDEIEARYEASIVRAPVAGMVMAPEASDGRREAIKKEGDLFKEGDLILTIGATESFIINSQIGELSAGDIQINQPVQISGMSFPNILLQGKVDWIAATATIDDGEAYFPLRISIPEMPAEARKRVRFGMQAEAAIHLSSLAGVITVPFAAVSRQHGQDVVLVGNEPNSAQPRRVETGYSDGHRIVITKGVQPGEWVLVPSTL